MSKNIGKYLHQNMDNHAGQEHAIHRTKIVATVGPACDSYDQLLALVKAGVNVFRLNFSHGAHEDKKQIIDHIRKISATEPYNIAILGHIQRGGAPSSMDRLIASRMGYAAVECLMEGRNNVMVGIVNNKMHYTPLDNAVKATQKISEEWLKIVKILAS